MQRFVLDSSAFLALIQKEKGYERVADVLDSAECFISTVNLSEVSTKLLLSGMPQETAHQMSMFSDLEAVFLDREIAFRAALLAPHSKSLGLSLGDRACLATALTKQAVALTTDRIWLKVKAGPPIEVIR